MNLKFLMKTTFHPADRYRDSRIVVDCDVKIEVECYTDESTIYENHKRAAQMAAEMLGANVIAHYTLMHQNYWLCETDSGSEYLNALKVEEQKNLEEL